MSCPLQVCGGGYTPASVNTFFEVYFFFETDPSPLYKPRLDDHHFFLLCSMEPVHRCGSTCRSWNSCLTHIVRCAVCFIMSVKTSATEDVMEIMESLSWALCTMWDLSRSPSLCVTIRVTILLDNTRPVSWLQSSSECCISVTATHKSCHIWRYSVHPCDLEGLVREDRLCLFRTE